MHCNPDLEIEKPLWGKGYHFIAGIDEAGRGAWAGPVSAGAVILPADPSILEILDGVRDSKQMTPLQRRIRAVDIRRIALAWGVGFATHAEIDRSGIVPATHLAMKRAIKQMIISPQYLLIDGLRLPQVGFPQSAVKKGDMHSLSIAAASVLAKTGRDALMIELDQMYPGYAFYRNKGYGTALHQAALLEFGPAEIHRRSFEPIHNLLRYGTLQPERNAGET